MDPITSHQHTIPTMQDITTDDRGQGSSSCPSQCTCTELRAEDIPGAILLKPARDLKKTELQFWLKCRALKYRSADTKAVLINRVEENMASGINHKIVDPDPNKAYTTLKKSKCLACCMKAVDNMDNENDDIEKCTDLCWGKSSKLVPNCFTYVQIRAHIEKSGKKIVPGTYIEKTLQKGYKFFYENYIHAVYSAFDKTKNQCFVKCLCFRSQRKSELPHKIQCAIQNDGNIIRAKCSCVAGLNGQCNHLVGLLFFLNHCNCMNMSEFPLSTTCTDNPQKWHRPRTSGLAAEPIMGYCVVKAQYDKQTKGLKSNLYEARAANVRDNSGIETLLHEMTTINPNFGLCKNLNLTSPFQYVKTRMNPCMVPLGSTLGHQLAIVEGDMEVYCNLDAFSADTHFNNYSIPTYPDMPMASSDRAKVFDDMKLLMQGKIDQVKLNQKECVALEQATVGQTCNDNWRRARQVRITSSNFGRIVRRKALTIEFAKSLQQPADLSNVPAIKYGREWEQKATERYIQYMENMGNPVRCFESGLIVHPDCPWLGASPDRKVIDCKAGFGLLEVKCPYSVKDIKPQAACKITTFCCEESNNGTFALKQSHDYYAQVQGQMALSGAPWCDFLVFTQKGMLIIRIPFDSNYWQDIVVKLSNFYVNYFQPALTG